MTNYICQGLNDLKNYLWLSQINLPQNKNLIFHFCCCCTMKRHSSLFNSTPMVKHCWTGLHNNPALLPLVWCCLMNFGDQSFNLEHNMTRRGLTWVHTFFQRIKNHWAKCSTLYISANRVLERVGGGFQGKKNLSRRLEGKKLQVIWCYFEKQTREQMFHHVRHGGPLGCHASRQMWQTDELGFTTERASDETPAGGGAATGVHVCECRHVRMWQCLCVSVWD